MKTANIYSDGYSVRVSVDNGPAEGFPYLSVPAPYTSAWQAALFYAFDLGAEEVLIMRPQGWTNPMLNVSGTHTYKSFTEQKR